MSSFDFDTFSDVEFLAQVIKLNGFTSVRNECHVMTLWLFSLSSGLLRLWAALHWHPIWPPPAYCHVAHIPLQLPHINQTPPSPHACAFFRSGLQMKSKTKPRFHDWSWMKLFHGFPCDFINPFGVCGLNWGGKLPIKPSSVHYSVVRAKT